MRQRQLNRDPTVEGSRTQQVRGTFISLLLYTSTNIFPTAGIIMSMRLLPAPVEDDDGTSNSHRGLSLISSYENGSVKLWKYRNIAKERSIEGIGWECVWSSKLHVESGEYIHDASLL